MSTEAVAGRRTHSSKISSELLEERIAPAVLGPNHSGFVAGTDTAFSYADMVPDAAGRITIVDSPLTPIIHVQQSAVAVETLGGAQMHFEFYLDAPSSEEISFQVATIGGSATAGSDFEPKLGSVRFLPGEKVSSLEIDVLDDALIEGAETFTLQLTAPVHGSLEATSVSVTIIDNEVSIVNPHLAQYIDSEGDLVKIRVSKGVLLPSYFDLITDVLGHSDLEMINLSWKSEFSHASIFISASGKHGDGYANIGFIDATGVDLTSVSIGGDLGGICAGDQNSATMGLSRLKVGSFGQFGLASSSGAGTAESVIIGGLGNLAIKTNFGSGSSDWGPRLEVKGVDSAHAADGQMGRVSIGGSILGSNVDFGGSIQTSGEIKDIRIRYNMEGGYARWSGSLIVGGNIGHLVVGGDIVGGSGANSGLVFSHGGIAFAYIGGDVKGGFEFAAGGIRAGSGGIGLVRIEGNLEGSSIGLYAGISTFDGGGIHKLSIAGSVTSAGVYSDSVISSIFVGGKVDWGRFTARGALDSSEPRTKMTIGSVTIRGDFAFGVIQAGVSQDLIGVDPDAQIGLVKVGGDLYECDITAGISSNGAGKAVPAEGFTDSDEVISRIVKIVVGGQVAAVCNFVAEDVHAFVYGGTHLRLTADKDFLSLGGYGRSTIYEI